MKTKFTLKIIAITRLPMASAQDAQAVLCTRGYHHFVSERKCHDAGIIIPTYQHDPDEVVIPTFEKNSAGSVLHWRDTVKDLLTTMIMDVSARPLKLSATETNILYYASDDWVHGLQTDKDSNNVYFAVLIPYADLRWFRFPAHAGNPKLLKIEQVKNLQKLDPKRVFAPRHPSCYIDPMDQQATIEALEWATQKFTEVDSRSNIHASSSAGERGNDTSPCKVSALAFA